MELRHLRYFVAVAEEQNFTRAAERLHIAQPPLSRQIQQLEEALGVTLFERHARPLKMTDAGRFFYSHAVQLLAQTAELEAMTKRVGKIERALSVGFVGSTLYGMLPRIIRRFRAEHGEVELSLHEMSTMDQIQALKDGRIDVGFGRIRHEDARVRRVVLREERMIVALPDGHPLEPLRWLVNFLAARGESVRAGQIVTTGSYAGAIDAPLGQALTVRFGELGGLAVEWVA